MGLTQKHNQNPEFSRKMYFMRKAISRKKKLRNLADVPEKTVSKFRSLPIYIIGTSLIVLLISLILYIWSNTELIHELSDQYDKQYNFLRYGTPDYCNQKYNSNKIIDPLQANILNQKLALDVLGKILENHSNITSIALIGTSGIGKSLTAHVIETNFQWQYNVLRFHWNAVTSAYSQYLLIQSELNSLTSCGQNLVIIDGIIDVDMDVIERFNNDLVDMAQNLQVNVLAIYVFNVPSYLNNDIELVDERIKKLKSLQESNIQPIVYKAFTKDDLIGCINSEASKLKIKLNDEQKTEIGDSIDAIRSGCKHVYRKVGLYN